MPAICPTNSTECLLRALVDANLVFNWNPLNFAFTAALSILGFIVATFALVQALLSASPGRLKANHFALGRRYSADSDTRFDRTELRFRTIAKVPLIDLTDFTHMMDEITILENIPKLDAIKNSGPWNIFDMLAQTQQPGQSRAGWCRLLENAAIENRKFDRIDCQTDYLPNDVQAAPAYATLDSLIILAMLSGCTKLQRTRTEDFLQAIGSAKQLDFRRHESLGVVAVYREYITGESKRTPNDQKLVLTILKGLGRLSHNHRIFSTAVLHPGSKVLLNLDHDWLTTLDGVHCTHRSCPRKGVFGFEPAAWWVEYFTTLHEYHPNAAHIVGITTLIFMDKPTSVELFPTRVVNFRQALRLICIHTYPQYDGLERDLLYLPEACKEPLTKVILLREKDRTHSLSSSHSEFDDFKHRSNWAPAMVDTAEPKPSPHRKRLHGRPMPEQHDFMLCDWVLQACFGWLNDANFFNHHSIDSKLLLEWITFQLQEVDWWLHSYGGEYAFCAAFGVIKLTDLARSERGPDGPMIPTFVRIMEKHLNEETLISFKIPYEKEELKEGGKAFLITKQLSMGVIDELFEHTRRARIENPGIGSGQRSAQGSSGQHEKIHSKGIAKGASDDAVNHQTDSPTVPENDAVPTSHPQPSSGGVHSARGSSDRDGGQDSGSGKDAKHAAKKLSPRPWNERLRPRDCALIALVLYRAILVATLLASGADTSELLLHENRRQIIQNIRPDIPNFEETPTVATEQEVAAEATSDGANEAIDSMTTTAVVLVGDWFLGGEMAAEQ